VRPSVSARSCVSSMRNSDERRRLASVKSITVRMSVSAQELVHRRSATLRAFRPARGSRSCGSVRRRRRDRYRTWGQARRPCGLRPSSSRGLQEPPSQRWTRLPAKGLARERNRSDRPDQEDGERDTDIHDLGRQLQDLLPNSIDCARGPSNGESD
jgi:hypothetical protein